jgi:hypothetical protein
MGIEAKASITLTGGSAALKTLQGVTRGVNETSKAGANAAKETERWQRLAQRSHQQRMKEQDQQAKGAAKSAAQQSRAAESAAKAQAKAAESAAKAVERAQERASRAAARELDKYQRVADRSARESVRRAERTAAAEVKAKRDSIRQIGGLLAAAGAGALAGGLAANSTARTVSGAKDVKTRIADANAFRERLVVATQSAGLNAGERDQVQGSVLAASTKTGQDAGDLLGVIEEGQAKFNSLKFFSDNLSEIATVAKASGADTKDLATALGYMRQAFGLTDKEAIESAYLIKAAADKGSVEVKDFAKDFAAGAGIFATNTGQKGIGGVRQLLGTAQAIGTGGFGSAESATRFERFSADLNDVGVRKGLAGIGVKGFTDASGKVDVGKLIQQLSTNRKFQNAGTRQGIFKETRSLQAVEALMAANQRVRAGKEGAVDFRTIAGVDAESGRSSVGKSFEAIQGEGFFKFQVENAKMFENTTTHLEEFNEQALAVVRAGDKLETSFGALSLWASSIAAAGVTSAVTGALTGGGKGGVLGKAGSAVLGAGGTAIGALGATGAIGGIAAAGGLAGAAVLGAGAVVGGLTGYYGGGAVVDGISSSLRDDKKGAGDALGSWLFDVINGGGDAREKIGGTSVTKAGTDGNGGAKDIVRVLERIDSGIRAIENKPKPDGQRGPR